ncbi:formate dehydrogenase major subunit [Robertmurraya andreesenii]|uniref:Formate dehydrogenase major subunit n=1 Tax=Anoxybacillus andreesenii TaxID=1325932 RepID=A0ABT9V0A8_9BACL|nr:formate dehydrogenase major subunit [Robertmurraya andreesenii]
MEVNVTRRQFLKLSGAVAATLAVVELGFDEKSAKAKSSEFKIAKIKPTPTICPYCSVGCGILVYATEDDVVYTEGDPDHPINEGTLCSKGTTVRQVYTSEKRITKPMYRAPGSSKWEEVDWEFALDKVTKNIKESRDKAFTHMKDGYPVNRTDNIAYLGGAALDNEECHLLHKFFRAGLGLTYIEHQARI